MYSGLLKVYDESGNPLGEVQRSAILTSEPSWDEKLQQRIHRKQVWDPLSRSWWALDPEKLQVPNSGIAYEYGADEDELTRPCLGYNRWVGHGETCAEDFFSKLQFLALDAPPTDDNIVGWQAGGQVHLTQMVAGGQGLVLMESIEPNDDQQEFWFVTPADVRRKSEYGYPAGRPCTFEEAAENLVENPTATNVREMYRAYAGINTRYGCTSGTIKFYKIVKGTSRLIDKIAFFAIDGWSFFSEKGESYFCKETD